MSGALEKALYRAIMQANMSIQEVQKTFGTEGEQLTDHQLAARLNEHCPGLKQQITTTQLIQIIHHIQNHSTAKVCRCCCCIGVGSLVLSCVLILHGTVGLPNKITVWPVVFASPLPSL